MDIAKKQIDKILVITLSNLGDVILTVPVMAALKKTFPRAALHVVAGSKAYGLLAGNAAIEKVIAYSKKWTLREKIRYISSLRRERYDFVLDFRNSLVPYLIGRPSGSLWLQGRVQRIESRYERYAALIAMLGLVPAAPESFPLYGPQHVETVRRTMHSKGVFNFQNLLVVAPGARDRLKRWPSRYFAELVTTIVRQEEMTAVIIGDANEIDIAAEVAAGVKDGDVINICNKISQPELAVIIERARLVLSNDSAAMHLANYYRRPVIAFFGPTSDVRYGFRSATARIARYPVDCAPCSGACAKNRLCMESLTPAMALPMVAELLRPKP